MRLVGNTRWLAALTVTLVAALLVAVTVWVAGCGEDVLASAKPNIAGTYKCVVDRMPADGAWAASLESCRWTIRSDGSVEWRGTVNGQVRTVKGNWHLKGNTLVCRDECSALHEYSLEDGKITQSVPEVQVWVKVK